MQKTIVDLIIAGGLFLFVTVLGMVGFGFIVAGMYLLLATHFSSWLAALLAGCAVLTLAILILLVFRLARGRDAVAAPGSRSSRAQGEGRGDTAHNTELFELAIELAAKSSLNARDATLIALIAGTVVGVSPALRRQILALFAGSADGEGGKAD